MVSYGSFDTHSLQVNAIDTTIGTHATLLGNVSNAIKAFQDDLKSLGVEDRVIGMMIFYYFFYNGQTYTGATVFGLSV